MSTTKWETCYDRSIYELKKGNIIEIADYTRGAENIKFNKRIKEWIKKHPEHQNEFQYVLYDEEDEYYPIITILPADHKPIVNITIKLTSMAVLENGVDKWATITVSKVYAIEFLKWLIKPANSIFIAGGDDWGSEYL